MIIVVIIFSLIYVILLTLILIAYYRDNNDLERRVLEIEKDRDLFSDYCETVNWLQINQEYVFKKLNLDKEDENNTQRECDCDMPCGRKGRPKGSKNIGGRRK